MFRRKPNAPQTQAPLVERITSVVADGISLRGKLNGAGGVRIEGAFDGDIELDGLLVIGPTGRVTCPLLKARHVIVAGAMRGDIMAERVEIRASGRVWGNVTTVGMSTEEGAFLRGQIQMEEKIELGITRPQPPTPPQESLLTQDEPAAANGSAETHSPEPATPEVSKFKRKKK
jgi:cytoskeletal protein CcmA (bactofilin family)